MGLKRALNQTVQAVETVQLRELLTQCGPDDVSSDSMSSAGLGGQLGLELRLRVDSGLS